MAFIQADQVMLNKKAGTTFLPPQESKKGDIYCNWMVSHFMDNLQLVARAP